LHLYIYIMGSYWNVVQWWIMDPDTRESIEQAYFEHQEN